METRSFWAGSLGDFLGTADDEIVGVLATKVSKLHVGDERKQVEAWEEQIRILKVAGAGLDNEEALGVLIELPLTRLGKRIDVILTSPQGVICIEFKVGGDSYLSADKVQAEDYALCLKAFHEASHDAPIYPVLCATEAKASALEFEMVDEVNTLWCTNRETLRDAIELVLTRARRCRV